MTLSRRGFALGTLALLAGCGAGGGAPRSAPARATAMQAVPNAGYDAWVAAFRGRAAAGGISESVLAAAFRSAGYLPEVIERDRNQAEVQRSLEDYLAIVAREEKVQAGRAALASRRSLLSEIEGRYGVPAEVVTAIWGMESNYGTRRGDIPVIAATSTLAYDGRRGVFFEKQLMAALRILQRGDTSADRMLGSWAGAMGHTQFIPTTFEAYAVDFRGDGRRDIWGEDPTDGLASAAAYLANSGWQRGESVALEVRLPSGFDTRLAGRGSGRTVGNWQALGVRPVAGGNLPGLGAASILLPGGGSGPAFMIGRNFDTVLRYNNAEKYGLGIGYLSRRIAGDPALTRGFGPDETGLTQAERRELQERLNARGFDAGTPDGVIGSGTEAAITAFQRSVGLPATGKASPDLLRRLR
ncbi:lytic murein transglycosylase [Mesobacterium pallidum]|uniref:lytic murein transglycosylase n=1 Tax=Mesobacterium pallidum TaxID=2872037 RepID=UPI001EE2F5A2|nr:lytic murein transglycosylase [Mesobacterium pallidum]